MYFKNCLKCGKSFETTSGTKKFCCRSCANSFTTTARKVPDESVFVNGINKTSAYILGLIYSDGCLSYDNHCHRFKITISLNDEDLMHEIHQLMTPQKKLYEYTHPKGRGPSYSVISCNENDIEFLRSKGVTERKSSNIIFPNIDDEFVHHFVRGYFDGDGSVYFNNTSTNYNNNKKYYKYINASFTTGSMNFAYQLCSVLRNNGIVSHVLQDSRVENNSWYVKIYDRQSLKAFYEWIYRDADLYLERKKLKFTEKI